MEVEAWPSRQTSRPAFRESCNPGTAARGSIFRVGSDAPAHLRWPSDTRPFSVRSFFEFEDYILRGTEADDADVQNVRNFESRPDATPRNVEWLLNHLHVAEIQYHGCPDIAADKLVAIGTALKKIYEARLAQLFPNKPCIVEFPHSRRSRGARRLSFVVLAGQAHLAANAPEGRRNVATSGAKRNPWTRIRFRLNRPGRGEGASRIPLPLAGSARHGSTPPRVSLRFTRGYSPRPRWGRKVIAGVSLKHPSSNDHLLRTLCPNSSSLLPPLVPTDLALAPSLPPPHRLCPAHSALASLNSDHVCVS